MLEQSAALFQQPVQGGAEKLGRDLAVMFHLKRMTYLYELAFHHWRACQHFSSDLVNNFPPLKESQAN